MYELRHTESHLNKDHS